MELNEDFQQLYRLVENTAANVFLTGKAGTGKTTFLRYLRENSHKRMVVAAPTGVAAINAGGVTLHSLFQLPFGTFIPNQPRADNFRFNNKKLALIRSLDLLVIDEISMVRADLLDAVDQTLRFVRRNQQPFGGLQLLLIGDMQQLPPVLQPQEEQILKDYYPSGYFFHSLALRGAGYRCVELKKVYRQSDAEFIDLLNAVRNNTLNAQQLPTLNARCNPSFTPPEGSHYIHLTTHNSKADAVNEEKMRELDSLLYTYKAKVEGQFPETVYPTDESLQLKRGAQVMFIKNDPGKRFYNGKIGLVTALADEGIKVEFPDGTSVDVPRMKWDNVQYAVNETTKEVEEKVIGSFDQYPLRLAWAITIHKSQGLTFDNVMLDANRAFAHGQVYVALSRCRSLEGLVLTSPISPTSITNDQQITSFNTQIQGMKVVEEQIKQLEEEYYEKLLIEQFDFSQINNTLLSLNRVIGEGLSQQYSGLAMAVYKAQKAIFEEVVEVALRFRGQIQTLVRSDKEQLQDRVAKGSAYFQAKLKEILFDLPAKLNVEVKVKDVKNKYYSLCEDFNLFYAIKRKTLAQNGSGFTVNAYLKAKALAAVDNLEEDAPPRKTVKSSTPKAAKTPTAQLTYELFKQGKRPEDVAKERGLALSTILIHLGQYVSEGKLDITEVVPRAHVEEIGGYLREHPNAATLTEVRDALGQKYDFNEIKLVWALPEYKRDKEKENK